MFTVTISIRRGPLRLMVAEATSKGKTVPAALASAIAGVLPAVPGGWPDLMRAVRDRLPERRPLAGIDPARMIRQALATNRASTREDQAATRAAARTAESMTALADSLTKVRPPAARWP